MFSDFVCPGASVTVEVKGANPVEAGIYGVGAGSQTSHLVGARGIRNCVDAFSRGRSDGDLRLGNDRAGGIQYPPLQRAGRPLSENHGRRCEGAQHHGYQDQRVR